MDKNELLNEQRYQKNKKKLKMASLCILIIGLLIGGGLIGTGVVKTNEVKKENERIVEKIEQKYDSSTSVQNQKELTSEITSLQQKADTLKKEITTLENEQTKIFMGKENGGFSDSYYAKDNEIKEKSKELSTIETKISTNESELSDIKSGVYESKKNTEIGQETKSEYQYFMLYAIGGMIILVSCFISGSIYMVSNGREMMAFQTQQSIPVAQEAMVKMAPTAAKAGKIMAKEMTPTYGEVAKEIAKGIKEGMKDEDNKS